MKPKTVLLIVLSIVITGEAIADYFARHTADCMATAIILFAIILIYSIQKSQKNRSPNS